jgi:hypothetical protein
MKEPTVILILVLVFAVFGTGVACFSVLYSDFNFYKAEITANGKTITENLYFQPDKDYHTLYRNFVDEATTKNITIINSIKIKDVQCEQGTAYFRGKDSSCTLFSNGNSENGLCPSYTEDNEYGCTFGNALGFKEKGNYFVQSVFELNSANLFKINGKNYIKFIAYSSDRHVFLKEDNFKTSSEIVRKDNYLPGEQVILYIPYTGSEEGFNVIQKENFEFDGSLFKMIIIALFALFPSIIIFFGWFFFGRENSYPDMPKELSSYPNEREGWEVNCFFNAPFGSFGKNFFSTMLISLYHKKVIDLQLREKDVWLKINKTKEKLDKFESRFLKFLEGIYDIADKKCIDGSYLYLKKALQSYKVNLYSMSFFSDLGKEIKKEQKKYLDSKGNVIVLILSFLGFFSFTFLHPLAFLLNFALIIFLVIVSASSALFVKFKGNYYTEYKHWQAFKKYLSHSFTIKHGDHRAVAIWDHYLIYATAMGVSKKVLKELKDAKIIDDKHVAIYTGVYNSSPSFAASTGTAGGGAGAGGVGGGGGGGR